MPTAELISVRDLSREKPVSTSGGLFRSWFGARAAAVMAPTTELLHDFLGKAITGQELF